MVIAQCFGVMPVSGIKQPDECKVIFNWRSLRIMLSVIYVVLGLVANILYLRRISQIGINAKNIGEQEHLAFITYLFTHAFFIYSVGSVFFSFSVIGNIFFFMLAQNWNMVMTKWRYYEEIFLKPPYKVVGWRLSTKIRITATLIFLLAISKCTYYKLN